MDKLAARLKSYELAGKERDHVSAKEKVLTVSPVV